jgi:hypothetical protein
MSAYRCFSASASEIPDILVIGFVRFQLRILLHKLPDEVIVDLVD